MVASCLSRSLLEVVRRGLRPRASALLLALLAAAPLARAQTIRQDFYVTNGTVNSVVPSGTTLYVGGSFSRVGPVTGSGVPLDGSTGSMLAGFPAVIGTVNAVVSDGAGGWFVGGTFTSVGGQSRTNLAHVLSDNTVSAWNPAPDGQVLALALDGGTLYAGGAFANAGGSARSRIAAIDATTGLATAWNPGANDLVRTIAVSAGLVYVGGRFTSAGGSARNRIAAIDATTGVATAWNPNASLEVFALAVSGSTVYAGGSFSLIGGQARPRVAALDAGTGLATSWNPAANNQVNAIVTDGTTVWMGGLFTLMSGFTRNRLASVSAATAALTGWDPNASGAVSSLVLQGSTIYAGGDFLTVSAQPRSRLAAIDGTSAALLSWDPGAFSTVNTLAAAGGTVYAGGAFSSMGGIVRNNLAAFDMTSGAATSWNPDVNGAVLALAVDAGVLYAGGTFATVNGQSRANVVAIDLPSGTPTAWNPGTDGQVAAVDVYNGVVYVGGLFGTAGGQPRANLAAFSTSTGAVTSWNPGTDGQIFDLEVNRVNAGVVYAGGVFAFVGGQPRMNLAAIDLASGTTTPWAPDPNGTIREIAVNCGVVYVGGFFTTLGGGSRSRLAALDAGTGLVTSWDPNANGPVFSIHIDNGFVYVGGIFGNVGGQIRNRLAAVDAASGVATPWNPNAGGTIRSVETTGGKVVVGGGFPSIGATLQANVAAMDADNSVACPAIAVAPTSFPAALTGTPFSQNVTASGGVAPYCYAVTEGSLPPGLMLSSSGTISGTPTTPTTSVFSVTATDARGCTGTQSCTIDVFDASSTGTVAADVSGLAVNPAHACVTVPVTFTRNDSAPARGFSITFQLETSKLGLCASPGVSVRAGEWLDAYSNSFFSVLSLGGGAYKVDGSLLGLPCGPTTGGTLFTIDVHSTGADGTGAVSMSSVSVRDCSNASIPALPGAPAALPIQNAPVVISPATLPGGTTGVAYGQALSAAPGTAPFTYSLTAGSLPGGLTLSAAGLLSGTPSAAGSFGFTVHVSDVYGSVGDRAYTLTIACPAIAIAPATLPGGLTGHPYAQTITATGGSSPYTFAVTTGTLPDGLALGAGGALAGTPTTAGTSAFTVGVTDTFGCTASLEYSLTIGTPTIGILPVTLLAATTGTPYARTLVAEGAVGPNTWAVVDGALPGGLALDTGTGAISGTPLAAGAAWFTVRVTDAYAVVGERSYTLPVFDGPITNFIAADPAGLCLGPAHSPLALPFVLTRTDAAPSRAISVSFQIDTTRIALASPADPLSSIHPGAWFTGFPAPIVQVTRQGAGAYTVDMAVAGLPCGPTTGGTLFTADLVATGPEGATPVAVTGAVLRDCDNQPLPVLPGPDASLTLDSTPPPALADLAAAGVASGNGGGPTTAITVTWTAPPSGTVALYRAPFGGYPEYDDLGGTAPDSALAPGGPWTLLSAGATPPYVDASAPRGFWYYVAFVTDPCGNVSPVSNRTAGTLDYVLGDVSDGTTRGLGNNVVALEDLTLLGANYGIGESDITSRAIEYLDVGPTSDGTVEGRPLTDDLIDFEDLMIFTSNWARSATAPPPAQMASRAAAVATGPESFRIAGPSLVRPGADVTVTLSLRGAGRVQGFSARLAWDATVVQPAGVHGAGFVEDQGGIVLSPGPGRVDAALLGARAQGLTGDGDVARFTFRVLRTGDPGFRIDEVRARDAANRPVVTDAPGGGRDLAAPSETVLLSPGPNPFRESSALVFALAQAGPVDLSIWSVDGRRVRTLVSGARDAGVWHEAWDGRDDARGAVAPGVYYVRLSASGRQFTTRLVHLR